ncbi:MAG: peptidoglycan-binding protein, partial [Pseudomonadota bacterium]
TLESMPAESDNASAPVFDGEQLNELSDDLRRLYNSTVDNNAQSMETFEAVRDTLEMMAQRLLQIEANVTSQANTYAHSQPMNAAGFVPSAPQMDTALVEPQPASRSAEEMDAEATQSGDTAKTAQKQSPIEETAGQVAPASYQEAKEEPEVHPASTTSVSEAQNAVNELFAAAKAQEAAELQNNMPVAPEPLTDIETPTLAMEPVSDISPSEGMDDEPLEPGTGGPDLAALVRQANERRKRSVKNGEGTSGTEFLAAARRAAQAAAEEANLIQEEIEMQTQKEEAKEPKGLFAKRKKTIFMAATAALLIAASLPLVSSFLGNGNPLSASNPTVVETQTPLADETSTEELATEEPASEVRSATPLGDSETKEDDNSLARSSEEILTSPNTSTGEVNLAVTNIAPEAGDQSASGFVKVDPTISETNSGEADDFASPAPNAPAVDVAGLEFAPSGLLEAVAGGDATAMFQIGRHFTDGIGVEKDLAKAAEWYKKSADLGFVPAQYIIGNFNEKGVGLPSDPKKAAEWYEKAASSGHVVAMHNLAVLNASPNVLAPEPNMENAYKWFARAAEYGVRDSQVNSGIFLAKGIGTKPDLVEAYKWFAIAAAAGDKDAESKREIISNALIPEQLTEAKQRVANWIPIEPNPNANDVEIPDNWKATLPSGPLAVNRNIISQTQKKLSNLGFDAGPADGLMGQKTRNAITAFQRENGLPVSGEIDAELVLALKSVAS